MVVVFIHTVMFIWRSSSEKKRAARPCYIIYNKQLRVTLRPQRLNKACNLSLRDLALLGNRNESFGMLLIVLLIQ